MIRSAILALCVLASALGAQNDPAAGTKPAPAADAGRLEALVRDLGSDDFATRTRATEELRGLGATARPALEKARASANLEQKTRAEALLEELGSGEGRDVRTDPLRPEDERDRLRSRFPVLQPRDAQRMPRPEDFKDLNEWMNAMSRALGGGLVTPPEWRFPGLPGTGFFPGGQEFRLELGPGMMTSTRVVRDGNEQLELREGGRPGIAVRITKIDPKTGEAAAPVESYEAPDMESFRQQFPEVHERVKAKGLLDGSGPIVHAPQRRLLPGRPQAPSEAPLPVPDADPLPPAPVLGVTLGEVPEALRAHVEIPENAVLVLDVVAGSAAERAGLVTHDILTTVNGVAVASPADVRAALEEAARNGGEARIVGVRKGKPFEGVATIPTIR